jgi:hypothetical protein
MRWFRSYLLVPKRQERRAGPESRPCCPEDSGRSVPGGNLGAVFDAFSSVRHQSSAVFQGSATRPGPSQRTPGTHLRANMPPAWTPAPPVTPAAACHIKHAARMSRRRARMSRRRAKMSRRRAKVSRRRAKVSRRRAKVSRRRAKVSRRRARTDPRVGGFSQTSLLWGWLPRPLAPDRCW